MTATDAAGLLGVLLMLGAYAGGAMGKLDPKAPPSLIANLIGAGLVLYSLITESFNLSATVMEIAWAAVALAGLARWALARRSAK